MTQEQLSELEALRRRVAELEQDRRMFLTGPVVVFKWVNAEGWPVEYVSPNVAEVLGYSVEDLETGRVPYAEIVFAEDLERVAGEVAAASEGGSERFSHKPYRIVHQDGRSLWVGDFTTILRDGTGAVTHYLGYIVDITELKETEASLRRLEAQVLHAQKLESLGIFASGVAHDFNNFLTGVLGNAGLVRMRLRDDSPLVPLVEEIEQAAEHASGVVDQMLTYAGKVEVEVESVVLRDLLVQMEPLIKSSISKKAELRLDLAEDLPAVRGNSGQLRQTVMNLVLNASDALGGEPGSITVSTEAVEADRAYLAAAYLDEDVLEAIDGVEALERFDTHDGKICGVLLDMTMPRLDGAETFRELRRREPDLAILLSSGFNSQQTKVDELMGQAGRADFLRKPYRPMVLIEKLQEVLSSETPS